MCSSSALSRPKETLAGQKPEPDPLSLQPKLSPTRLISAAFHFLISFLFSSLTPINPFTPPIIFPLYPSHLSPLSSLLFSFQPLFLLLYCTWLQSSLAFMHYSSDRHQASPTKDPTGRLLDAWKHSPQTHLHTHLQTSTYMKVRAKSTYSTPASLRLQPQFQHLRLQFTHDHEI